MLEYLQKYNNLPKDLRDKIGAPAVISAIDDLEKKYGAGLAPLIMKVMTKELDFDAKTFSQELNLDISKANSLMEDLKNFVFKNVLDYLGLNAKKANRANLEIKKQEEEELVPYEEHLPLAVNQKPAETKKMPEEKPNVQTATVLKPETPKSSNFFFSVEDEEEVKELAKKIETINNTNDIVEENVQKILKIIDVNFGSELLRERFKQIVRIYLKGIRNRIDTKASLMKSFEAGGLSFDETSTEAVLNAAEKFKNSGNNIQTEKPKKMILPEDGGDLNNLKDIGMRDVEIDLNSKKITDMPKEEKEEPRTEEKKEPIDKKEDKPKTKPELKKEEKKIPETQKPTPVPVFKPLNTVPEGGKIKMEDIKYVPRKAAESRVMSPIDELRNFDLVNFRRLAFEDPFRVIEKIKEKIKLLEDESYSKKIEGIKAWRMSPVNKLYLAIGEESILRNEPIDVVIEERKVKGEEYLNSREFEAIMDLNKDLRF